MSQTKASPMAALRRSKWLSVPPPPLFVAAFLAGALLDRWAPLALLPSHPAALRLLGLGLIALAALTLIPAPALFLWHRTTIIPHGSARSLVTTGPYRFTRNPMYLALAVGYVGVALALNLAWPLVFWIVPVWVLHHAIIPFEEANLERIFGAEYQAYQRRVRRWI